MTKKRSFGRRLGRALLLTLLLILAGGIIGALLIAEPWVSDQIEHTIAPLSTDMGLVELSLGDEYVFDIELGANEIISSIDSEYPTVMEPIGYGIKANGAATEVKVTVTTREAILSGRSKRIVFFGRDYSEPYYNLRRALRSLVGVENTYTLPSELRVLNIYHYRFLVPEYPIEQAGHINIKVGSYADIAPKGLGDNIYTSVRSADPSLIKIKQLVTDNDYRLFGQASGKTEVTVHYGFYIQVNDAGSSKTNRFVPVRAQRYTVQIND